MEKSPTSVERILEPMEKGGATNSAKSSKVG